MGEAEPPRKPGMENEDATRLRKVETPCVRSDELLAGGREIRIMHGNEVYRLLLTRNNKLILQK